MGCNEIEGYDAPCYPGPEMSKREIKLLLSEAIESENYTFAALYKDTLERIKRNQILRIRNWRIITGRKHD